ncbi:MAG: hypothetical protein WEC37_03900 [Anaerolineales bacterium]
MRGMYVSSVVIQATFGGGFARVALNLLRTLSVSARPRTLPGKVCSCERII